MDLWSVTYVLKRRFETLSRNQFTVYFYINLIHVRYGTSCNNAIQIKTNGLTHLQEGGPIGLIENGDLITIDVGIREINVNLTDKELDERRKKWSAPAYKANRGVLYKVQPKNLPSLFTKLLFITLTSPFLSDLMATEKLFINFQYIKNVQSASNGCVTDE